MFYFCLKLRSVSLLFFLLLFIIPLVGVYVTKLFLARGIFMISYPILVGLALLICSAVRKIYTTNRNLSVVIIALTSTFYIFWFLSYNPYLHYVDPPYDVLSATKDLNANKPSIFIVEDGENYIPLVQYGLRLSKFKQYFVISLSKFMAKYTILNHPFDLKEKLNIYYVDFISEQKIDRKDTFNLTKFLQCSEIKISDSNIYIAQCK